MPEKTFLKRFLMQRRLWVSFVLTMIIVVVWAGASFAADPSGAATIDLENDPAGAAVAAVNSSWVLIAAFLVFFMQIGFALLEAGSTGARNSGSVFMKNLMDFCMCGLAFWAFGFAIMFGGSEAASGLSEGNAFIGFSGFFLAGEANDVGTMQLWIFQMVFAATAATIVSGAMAERTKLNTYMAYSFLISALIYPIYGHWVWGGGWLSTLPFGAGAVDFAGSGVVHAVGGIAALVGALMVGARKGKFIDGRPRSLPGHNMGYVVLGTMILLFGWFGFNAGSTLAATDLRISSIAVNTFLAAIAGGLVAYYIQLARTGRADIAVTCSGVIGGLVAITAPCAFVAPWASVLIGAIAGALVIAVAEFLERRLGLDDPVWAVACHGGCGLFGMLAVGIFADGSYGDVGGLIVGDTEQIIAQLISIVTVVAWTGLASALLFGVLKSTIGLRVSEQDELAGMDVSEFVQPGLVFDQTVMDKVGTHP
ncbi:MAG TPA: ammonium transporter [Actinomycetota bacterium]|nr:ammonium transporter [Actinomycetota bacterium]